MTPSKQKLSITPETASRSLKIYQLSEVWNSLTGNETLSEVSEELHRGVEWKQPFDKDKYISRASKTGFKRGLHLAQGMRILSPIETTQYLDTREESRRGNAYDLPWKQPKVLMNATRVSRGPWCLAAFSDDTGLLASQNFFAIWPKANSGWTTKSLAAVLNGPVASAFVAVREDKLRIRINEILSLIPLPKLDGLMRAKIESMADLYIDACGEFGFNDSKCRSILLKLDSLVLSSYNLPPPLERMLLELFRGQERPVTFDTQGYIGDLLKMRIKEQTRVLETDVDDQAKTWSYFKKNFDEDRLSRRKIIS